MSVISRAKRVVKSLLHSEQKLDVKHFKHFGMGASLPTLCIIKNAHCISIGKNFYSLYNLRIEAWDSYAGQQFSPEIIIGDNVNMNTDCHIGCINKVVIGNNVLMASRIYISDHFHGEINAAALSLPPMLRPLYTKGPVIIEDNVWIGEGVCIMPGVVVGANSIIGANAVVTKSVPANAVVGGNPAKVIRILI
jgi:acetyltransferase-like isoleucine patch superfamily enzyme